MMKTAIIPIVFNLDPRVFIMQINAIKLLCRDENFTIEVVDNSSVLEMADAIEYHARVLEVNYTRVRTWTGDPSESHAFAANLSFKKFAFMYGQLLFLDHDAIPVKPFSVEEMLGGKVAGGVLQGRELNYFWPGCFVLNTEKCDHDLVNFWPDTALRLDTGGGLKKIKDQYGDEGCVYFDEVGHHNPYFPTHPEYYFFMMLYKETFMHFLNTSNWRKVSENESRINSLLQIAEEKIKSLDLQ